MNKRDLKRVKKQETFFRMIGSKGAVRILQILDIEEEARYKTLQESLNTYTLNSRIKDLLNYDLIQHHLVREEVRKEWYELTERGRRIVELLNEIAENVDVQM